MRTDRIKILAVTATVTFFALMFVFKITPTKASPAVDDPATIYRAKCMACHTPTASKFFDATKSDEEHVNAILNGKKGDKPPYMPAYAEKGITEGDAKALTTYMKGLRTAN